MWIFSLPWLCNSKMQHILYFKSRKLYWNKQFFIVVNCSFFLFPGSPFSINDIFDIKPLSYLLWIGNHNNATYWQISQSSWITPHTNIIHTSDLCDFQISGRQITKSIFFYEKYLISLCMVTAILQQMHQPSKT